MRNLLYILFTSSLVLAPTFAFANTYAVIPLPRIEARAEVHASTTMQMRDEKPRPLRPEMTASSSVMMRVQMRADIEAKQTEVHAKVEAAKEKAKEKFGEAVQKSVGNITDMLTKAIEGLTNIANRIDARITELQGKGFSMSTSVTLLAKARTDIASAQTATTAVGTTLTAALSSATPKTDVPKVRAAVKAAEEAIHTAKQSLQKTLESVRVESHASSSVQTSTNL